MKIYNSLTYEKDEFEPLNEGKVLMYVCGPTVYDSPHLGHAKSAVAFDLIRRYLEFKGYDVKIVKNYTDIDDKIIKRANKQGIDYQELSERYIEEYREVMDILNVKPEDINPRATDVIDFMIKMTQDLIEKGHAYENNSSVYFEVKTFPKYLSVLQKISEDELEEDEEEESGPTFIGEKKDLKDFALWKKAKEGEPSWDSPWGKGRPGWHIECSAMCLKYLGDTIDIHGGGQDLKFPHHRNEVAQSETYTGKQFVRYFIHNGFVNVDDEKMSKSLGNFFTVTEVVKEYDPMVIRFFLLTSHYRSSLNYSTNTINQARKNYEKILNTIIKINDSPEIAKESKQGEALYPLVNNARKKIIEAMDDDFNTPIAIAQIMTLTRDLNREIIEKETKVTKKFKDEFFQLIRDIDKIFGIFPHLEQQLEAGVMSSFDERGKVIVELLKIIKYAQMQIKENYSGVSFPFYERLIFILGKEPDISEPFDLVHSGSFDKRGDVIKKLLELIADVRKELRSEKKYDLSDDLRDMVTNLGIRIEDK